MIHYPESLEQLQTVVRQARETGTPLIARSSMPPYIHGLSSDPSAETVSFAKMNRILKIDRPNRYVRVEAGVTYADLIPEAAKCGLRLNHPFLPRAGKSVVASLLEREGGITAKYQYDYHDPLLNAEVVYGTGDVFRTGSAAGPGPIEELTADMVCPWGPGTIDFIRFLCGAQGTMGFVTWTTVKAELLPSESELYLIESDDLSKLTKLANELQLKRIPDDCVILNRVNFAAAFSEDESTRLKLLKRSAPWILLCRICGYERYPLERIALYSAYLQDCCKAAGLKACKSLLWLDGMEGRIEKRLTDCDRGEVYWKLRFGGLSEFVFLSPPSKTPGLIDCLIRSADDISSDQLGLTLIPQVQGRAFRTECDLYYDNSVSDEKLKTEKRSYELQEQLLGEGAFFDRPYGAIAEKVFAIDPAATATLKKLKDIFDPAGILNPGKLCF